MDYISAIQSRKSVRTYADRPIEANIAAKLEAFIDALDNPYGINDIRIGYIDKAVLPPDKKLGTYGVIKGAKSYFTLMCPTDPDAIVMAGFEFEKLLLYATSLGLGTVWLGGTFSHADFEATAPVCADSIMPAVSPVGYADDRRFMEKVMRTFVRANTRKPFESICFDGDFSTPLKASAAGKFAAPLEMVRIAPSATNTQPWRILRDGRQFHFYGDFIPSDNKTTTMRYLDMGIAICHFLLSARQLGLSGSFSRLPAPPPAPFTYISTWSPA